MSEKASAVCSSCIKVALTLSKEGKSEVDPRDVKQLTSIQKAVPLRA